MSTSPKSMDRIQRDQTIADFKSEWGPFIRDSRPPADRTLPVKRFVDLFASVGGLSLGASLAMAKDGYRGIPLLAADVDESALAVYSRNLRPREVVGRSVAGMVDFRVSGAGSDARFSYEPVVTDERLSALNGSIDVLLAGPPCQGHSSLNNHSRHDDPKNLLYLTVPAVAVATGAKHVVIENVPNVVADRRGVVQTTITLLRDAGYQIEAGVLAADKFGWPQTRRRFFLVASKDSSPAPFADVVGAYSAPATAVGWLLGDLITSADSETADIMNAVPSLSAENRARVDYLFDNDIHDLPNSERPDCHKDGTTYSSSYGRMHWELPAPTITGGFLSPGRGRFVHPKLRRVLTPREAARVQGFPDWFDFIVDESRPPSRSQLTRWIGNAVPTILGRAAVSAALEGEAANRAMRTELVAS